MEPILAKGMGFLFFALPLATNDSRRLIYALLYALCSMLYEDGAALVGRMCVEPPWERVEPFKG